MRHPLYIAFALTLLIVTLLAYRQVCIAVVEAFGIPSAIVIVAGCYALARLIHHRETRGY